MGLIFTLIIGLIAGALGKLIMPGKDPGGLLITMLLGIGGAFVGRVVGGVLPIIPEGDGGMIGRIVSATIGAVILLFVYRFISKKRLEASQKNPK